MQNFPIVTSCLMMTISVGRRLGGLLAWILDIKRGTERQEQEQEQDQDQNKEQESIYMRWDWLKLYFVS